MKQTELSDLISNFVAQLVSVIEQATAARITAALRGAFAPPKRGPGRPPKSAIAAGVLEAGPSPRRKAPKQLCPVPGCKNPAAPVFGMVCAKHKDLPKTKIKQYREQRRAEKAKKAA